MKFIKKYITRIKNILSKKIGNLPLSRLYKSIFSHLKKKEKFIIERQKNLKITPLFLENRNKISNFRKYFIWKKKGIYIIYLVFKFIKTLKEGVLRKQMENLESFHYELIHDKLICDQTSYCSKKNSNIG